MEIKLPKLLSFKMTILSLKSYMKKYIFQNDSMNESELKRVYNSLIYLRDSKIISDKGYINIDNGPRGGTPWSCFVTKDSKPYYFDSFGGQPDKFLLDQLHKPIFYHNYKIQDINSRLCGS